jgi:hypothetical protein
MISVYKRCSVHYNILLCVHVYWVIVKLVSKYMVFISNTNLEFKRQGRLLSEKFEHVTILFSDIVTFTNIAAACTPMNIVTMLNDLYQRFDAMTSVHDVYKV